MPVEGFANGQRFSGYKEGTPLLAPEVKISIEMESVC